MVQSARIVNDFELLDSCADLLGPLHGDLKRGLWKNHNEFLTAVAARDVFGSDPTMEKRAYTTQDRVAGGVTITVVVALKVVEVEH